jgi:hypothetical protein
MALGAIAEVLLILTQELVRERLSTVPVVRDNIDYEFNLLATGQLNRRNLVVDRPELGPPAHGTG